MISKRIGNWALWGLVLLAAVQVALVVTRSRAPEPGIAVPPPFLAVGDSPGEASVTDALDEVKALVDGAESMHTLVLAFHSECAHCATVAPAWAEWLRDREVGVRVVGVSREPVETSAAYAAENGWDLDVVRVSEDFQTLGGRLVMRTPWLFVLDPDGTIVYEGHGSRLDELSEVLRDVLESPTVASHP